MHILMTYASQGILGGVETLMARMSRWLVRNGHEVTFLIGFNKAWANIIDEKRRVVYMLAASHRSSVY